MPTQMVARQFIPKDQQQILVSNHNNKMPPSSILNSLNPLQNSESQESAVLNLNMKVLDSPNSFENKSQNEGGMLDNSAEDSSIHFDLFGK